MSRLLRVESKCPECDGPVENGWIVCAECGASLSPANRRPAGKHRESALPSGDIGYTAFVPHVGGAKRPITFVSPRRSASIRVDTPSDSPIAGARHEDVLPSAPPTENSRHRITVLRPSVVPPVSASVTDLEEDELYVEIDARAATDPASEPQPVEADLEEATPSAKQSSLHEAFEPRPAEPEVLEPSRETPETFEATPVEPELLEQPEAETTPEPDLPLSQAVREAPIVETASAVKRQLALRIARDDMSQIQSIVDAVVRQRLRELLAAQTAAVSKVASTQAAATDLPVLHRIAAGGAGLLVGAAAADLLVLNWDIWVSGQVASSIGWLQQLGVMGAAALAGAGAAATVIGSSLARRRRRALRRARQGSLA